MDYLIEFEQEDDGRGIAEIPDLPGVMAYGATRIHAGEKSRFLPFAWIVSNRIIPCPLSIMQPFPLIRLRPSTKASPVWDGFA